jgi:hypothetical protein
MSEPASIPQSARFPNWQAEVEAAVNEADSEKLLARVHTAEVAIFNRLQELGKLPRGERMYAIERDSLASALETLRLLKRDRLGFPDWRHQ